MGQTGYTCYLAWAHVLRAQSLRKAGQSTAAESAAQEGLRLATDIAVKTRIVDGLEAVAGVAADMGGHLEAARLFGAAQRLRDDTGYRRCVSTRDADVDALRAVLGDDAFQDAYEQGRSLALDDVVAAIRRGSGEPNRP
jgi:hypothetical protein